MKQLKSTSILSLGLLTAAPAVAAVSKAGGMSMGALDSNFVAIAGTFGLLVLGIAGLVAVRRHRHSAAGARGSARRQLFAPEGLSDSA